MFCDLKLETWSLNFVGAVFAVGRMGVEFFFCLSGFLITTILLERKHTDSHFFRNFYIRRIIRIFPPFYLLLAFTFTVLPLFGASRLFFKIPPIRALLCWAYLSNFIPAFDSGGSAALPDAISHTWSLAIEEQFYIVWPFVVFFLTRVRLKQLCIALIVLSVLVRAVSFIVFDNWPFMYFATPSRLDGLALGGLVSIVSLDPDWRRRLRQRRRQVVTLCILLLVTLFVFSIAPVLGKARLWVYVNEVFGISLAGQTTAFAILGVLHADSKPAVLSALSGRILPCFGKYSYAMYIVHQPLVVSLTALPFFKVLGRHTPLAAVGLTIIGMLVFTVLLSFVSWHVLEKPAQRLRKYFV